MKNKVIFVTGGARSGKSDFALRCAEKIGRIRAYIATAEVLDDEMKERITNHKRLRGDDWDTIEEPKNLLIAFESLHRTYDVAIIDCLTLWVSNLIKDGLTDDTILKMTDAFMQLINRLKLSLIIVSNEVGMGIVPDNPLARRFRDIAGKVNQLIASISDEVYFMVSGISIRIK
ncbi:MAG: bifunctional adenosylcobinamide kinase/adenosylcobinamide-phosphate guanylyltransferase [Nitrospinota bacterium]|jgi:adenosylcobinamide kinase/adenosylcobinamide-phosphate guanylyltransferase